MLEPDVVNVKVAKGQTVDFTVRLWEDVAKTIPFPVSALSAISYSIDGTPLPGVTVTRNGENGLRVQATAAETQAAPAGVRKHRLKVTSASGKSDPAAIGTINLYQS